MKFDLEKKGLETILLPYQVDIMRYIWNVGMTDSRHAYDHLQGTENAVSRASVIFFLKDMAEEGFLDYSETTGKGGHKGIWRPDPSANCERTFKQRVTERILAKISELNMEAST